MSVRPIDPVADPTTPTAWEHVEHVDRSHREASVERIRTVVGRGGR